MNSMRSDVATGGQADPGKLQWLMTSTLWLKEGQSGLTDLGKNTWFKGKLPVLEPCCTMDHHRQFSPSPINMHDLHDRKSTSPALPGKGQGCHEASHWETDIEPPFKKFESQDHIFFLKWDTQVTAIYATQIEHRLLCQSSCERMSGTEDREVLLGYNHQDVFEEGQDRHSSSLLSTSFY